MDFTKEVVYHIWIIKTNLFKMYFTLKVQKHTSVISLLLCYCDIYVKMILHSGFPSQAYFTSHTTINIMRRCVRNTSLNKNTLSPGPIR